MPNQERLEQVHKSANFMESAYLHTLGIHHAKYGNVSIDQNNSSAVLLNNKALHRRKYVPFKYLPDSLKIGKMYRKGMADSFSQTAQINSLHNLLRHYLCVMCLTGTNSWNFTHWYKILITAKNRQYRYFGTKFIDGSGQLAYQNYSNVIKSFRKYVNNSNSDVILHALRLRNEPYRQFHVHGLLSTHSTNCIKLSVKYQQYLSDKLGYDVSVKINPLTDIVSHSGTGIITDDTEPMSKNALANIQIWLKYINRSFKLAFPNTTHPKAIVKQWQSMTPKQHHEYVVDTLINSKGIRCSFNYGYANKMKSLANKITKQNKAIADDKRHERSINRWAMGLKHITYTQQWAIATDKQPYAQLGSHFKQLDIFRTNHKVNEPNKWVNKPNLGTLIHTLIAVLAVERGNGHAYMKKATTSRTSNGIKQDRPTATATVAAPPWFEKRTSGIPP